MLDNNFNVEEYSLDFLISSATLIVALNQDFLMIYSPEAEDFVTPPLVYSNSLTFHRK